MYILAIINGYVTASFMRISGHLLLLDLLLIKSVVSWDLELFYMFSTVTMEMDLAACL